MVGLRLNGGNKPSDVMVMRIDPATGLSMGRAVRLGQLQPNSGQVVNASFADGFLWVSAGGTVWKLRA